MDVSNLLQVRNILCTISSAVPTGLHILFFISLLYIFFSRACSNVLSYKYRCSSKVIEDTMHFF